MSTLINEREVFLRAEGRVILCACPGSGKTCIVAQRLLSYTNTWHYSHKGVAVLSFTNVASEEINRQTNEASLAAKPIDYPHFVGTIDSFINNFILLRFGYLMQNDNRKRPIIVHDNYGELTFFSRDAECYKRGCTNDPYAFHWAPNGLLRNNKDLNCGVSNKPCVIFKKALLRKGIVTQREVAYLSLLLLKRYPQIATELAHRFPIIIVDEAQDTSREQMAILDKLSIAGVQTLVLVGDPDQAIYEWRDATPEYFINKMKDGSWHTLYLSSNFRSSQKICDATVHFSQTLSGRGPAKAEGENATYYRKPILLLKSTSTSREDILQRFQQYCQECGIEYSNEKVAVLTRSRIHTGTDINGLWKSAEVKSLAETTYAWYLGSRISAYYLCEKALYNMVIGDVQSLSQEEIRENIERVIAYSVWKMKVIAVLKCLPSPRCSLQEWRDTTWSNINSLINKKVITLRSTRVLSDIIKIKSWDRANPDFLNQPLADFIEKKAIAGVTISSVHGVKGETFDAVLLIVDSTRGANTLTPTVLNNSPLTDELIRIAYVAMTRPRKLLVVSIPKTSIALRRFPTESWEHVEI